MSGLHKATGSGPVPLATFELLEKRSRLLQAIRHWFLNQGFLEIDPPVTSDETIPEEHIRPLALAGTKKGKTGPFLLPSPEIHLKPLLATGASRIFAISKAFRMGECGHVHMPEFTILEWYRAGQDYHRLMEDCQQLILHVMEALDTSEIRYRGRILRPEFPFPSRSVSELFRDLAGWDPLETEDPDRFDLDMVERVEPALGRFGAVFVKDFPVWQASLARLDTSGRHAERVELYMAGLELANGFSELMDPKAQQARFETELCRMKEAGHLEDRPHALPKRFLEGLERCPSKACGMALGIDRLFMLLAGVDHIRKAVSVHPFWLCPPVSP